MTLPYLKIVRAKGRVYVYAAPPGKPRVRLPAKDDPGFLAAYAKAVGTAPPKHAGKGTIVALSQAYQRTDAFQKGLAPGYRSAVRRHLTAIEEQADDALIGHLKPEHIRDDLAPLIPNVAAARLKAWRLLCAYAKTTGARRDDPSEGIKRKPVPKTDGNLPWEPEHIEAYRGRWPIGTTERLCMEVVYWTAARVSDAVLIGPQMVGKDGVLAFKQAKTKRQAFVPWDCPLPHFARHLAEDRRMMHAAVAAAPVRHLTFLATSKGRTRSKTGLGNLIRNAAREAGVERSAHGLRKAMCISLAEGGASSHDGSSWSGHVTLDEWEHYIALANRRKAVQGVRTKPARRKTSRSPGKPEEKAT